MVSFGLSLSYLLWTEVKRAGGFFFSFQKRMLMIEHLLLLTYFILLLHACSVLRVSEEVVTASIWMLLRGCSKRDIRIVVSERYSLDS